MIQEETDTPPEEAGEVSPVPLSRVKHVRGKYRADYAGNYARVGGKTLVAAQATHCRLVREADLLQHAAERHSLDLESARGYFTHQRIADRANSELVTQSPAQHNSSGGQRRLVPIRSQSQES